MNIEAPKFDSVESPDAEMPAPAPAEAQGEQKIERPQVTEQRELPKSIPVGFSKRSEVGRGSDVTTDEMVSTQDAWSLQPGEYNSNNGVYALADKNGDIYVMNIVDGDYQADRNAARKAKALRDLDSMGYVNNPDKHVPLSNVK